MEEPDSIKDPNKYQKFKKVDGAAYQRVNQFLRKHTHITAREWAIARLCADFKTTSGSEMTFIGENPPRNSARSWSTPYTPRGSQPGEELVQERR